MNALSLPFLLANAPAEPLARQWDTPGEIVLKLGAVLGLVLLNGFFVASEFAMVKVRDSQLEALEAEDGAPGKRLPFARRIVQHLDAYLAATQIGITLASLGLGWVGEPFIAQVIQPFFFKVGIESEAAVRTTSFILAFGLITYFHIVFGELAPKWLAIRKPVPTTLWIAIPLHFFSTVLRPAIWVLNRTATFILRHLFRLNPVGENELGHSEEELRVILAESQKSNEVTSLGKELLINALDLRRRVVRDIMTPRNEVIYLDLEKSFDDNLRRAIDSRHTRFPLCRGHLDKIAGLVHVKDALALMRTADGGPPLALLTIKRDLLLVPEMMPLEKLLQLFLARGAHLGAVVDEFGGTVGIVTLDNVLAELVGDIRDEFDAEQTEFQRVGADEFLVKGTLGLYELREHSDLEIESAEVSTVGGYIIHRLGHIPRAGEQVRVDNYLATVTQSDGRRVNQVRFRRAEPEAEADGEK